MTNCTIFFIGVFLHYTTQVWIMCLISCVVVHLSIISLYVIIVKM